MSNQSRILFLQHGDYREAVDRFARGGDATFYAQRFSVDLVGDLTSGHEYVGVIALALIPYDELLANGVHGMGMNLQEQPSLQPLLDLIEAQRPTHIILRTPLRQVIQWATKHKVAVLPLLADSFCQKGIRKRFNNWRLAAALNHDHIAWVANHNTIASKSLQQIGVDPKKILPWDWETMITPHEYPIKSRASNSPDAFSLFFAGQLTQSKGVGDAIRALQLLKQQGKKATLSIAGAGGDNERFRREVAASDVENEVTFLGAMSQTKVVESMQAHDAILVPSRHDYPEGLPRVIYEGLCTRTPLVVSDHPMFHNLITDNKFGLVFRAGDATHMAARIGELMHDHTLYANLSLASAEAWQSMECPLKWGELIHHFLRDSSENNQSLRKHTLLSRNLQ